MTTLSDVMAVLAHLLYVIAWVWLFAAWRPRRRSPRARTTGRLLPVLAAWGALAVVSDAFRMASAAGARGGAFTAIAGVALTALMLVLTERLDRLPAGGEDAIADRLVRLDAALHRIDPALTALDFDMTVMPARLGADGMPAERYDALRAEIRPDGVIRWDGRDWGDPARLAAAWAVRLRDVDRDA